MIRLRIGLPFDFKLEKFLIPSLGSLLGRVQFQSGTCTDDHDSANPSTLHKHN